MMNQDKTMVQMTAQSILEKTKPFLEYANKTAGERAKLSEEYFKIYGEILKEQRRVYGHPLYGGRVWPSFEIGLKAAKLHEMANAGNTLFCSFSDIHALNMLTLETVDRHTKECKETLERSEYYLKSLKEMDDYVSVSELLQQAKAERLAAQENKTPEKNKELPSFWVGLACITIIGMAVIILTRLAS